jgi:flagellar hook assembly protein FlgD
MNIPSTMPATANVDAGSTGSTTAVERNKAKQTKDMFLKLLVAQMNEKLDNMGLIPITPMP